MPSLYLLASALLAAAPAAAQTADTTEYVVLRGADTVVTERVVRQDVTMKGEYVLRAAAPVRTTSWSLVLDPQGAAALVEAIETQEPAHEKEKKKVLHRTRVIFKADSAAVDDMTSNGMMTDIYPTRAGAVPYLNLSVGMLEAAVKKALRGGATESQVPLFNLGGAQTAVATVRRTGEGRASLVLGTVTFDIALDAEGQVAEATIPSQNVRITRR